MLQMVTPKGKGGDQQSADRTEFSEMGGSLVFTNGVGINSDLVVKSPMLRLEGAGKLDLPKERLDYQATVTLVIRYPEILQKAQVQDIEKGRAK